MESILVLVHPADDGQTLTRASLEAVTSGKELAAALGADLAIGIVAADPNPLAPAVASSGARLLAVAGEPFAPSRFATDAAACEALCRAAHPTLILAPQSARFARVAAAVAHRLGAALDTHVSAIRSTPQLQIARWYYRQRIEAVLERSTRPWFLLLDSGIAVPFVGTAADPNLETIPVQLPSFRTRFVEFRSPQQSAQTIRPDAKVLFVAGAGWTKKQPDGEIHVDEAGRLILDFLSASGASLGSSKSLVDQGAEGQAVLPFLSHLNQIGQTGSTPRHAKGLSTCCHGEEPHVVGWRFVRERRAISLDPNCGWARGKADVVYIADAFRVIRQLTALLPHKHV